MSTRPSAVLTLARAADFAARKHSDQRRKGVRAEPYLNHLTEVARLLAEATNGADLELVVAGLLHDILEDTDTDRAELETAFGAVVTALVTEVSDDKSLPKAERKRQQIARASTISPRARLIKIADKTSNLRALVTSPPVDWPLERRCEYFAWASAVVTGCRGLNAVLEAGFDDAYRTGLIALEPKTLDLSGGTRHEQLAQPAVTAPKVQ